MDYSTHFAETLYRLRALIKAEQLSAMCREHRIVESWARAVAVGTIKSPGIVRLAALDKALASWGDPDRQPVSKAVAHV